MGETNLELPSASPDLTGYIVNQYSPSVHAMQRVLRHTKRTTKTALSHHTHTTHTGKRKRPRTAPDPIPEHESNRNMRSSYPNYPYILAPNAPKRTKVSHPDPPHQHHRNNTTTPTTLPADARPNNTITNMSSTQPYAHKHSIQQHTYHLPPPSLT